jgi:thiamine pyrophosphokinase
MSDPVIILLDGDPPSSYLLATILPRAQAVIAADGAAETAYRLSLPLDVIAGDMDSLSMHIRDHYAATGTRFVDDGDQYSNDYEKALKTARERYADSPVITLGLHGKRTDHSLTNLSVMLRFTEMGMAITALDDTQHHLFLTRTNSPLTVRAAAKTIVSLTPMPFADGVHTDGLFYPITKEYLEFGKREGLSNYIVGDNGAVISLTSGALLVSYHHDLRSIDA